MFPIQDIVNKGPQVSKEKCINQMKAEEFIYKLIDSNFDDYFLKLGFNSGFDKFKVRQMIFDELSSFIFSYVFRNYGFAMNGINLFNTYSGTWDNICRKAEFALGWVEPDENIDEKIRRNLIIDKRNTYFGKVLSILNADLYFSEEEVLRGREEIDITGGYKLTEGGKQIINGYFNAIGVDQLELLRNNVIAFTNLFINEKVRTGGSRIGAIAACL